MKVLQLCKKFPYPLRDGESIAVNFLSKSLIEHGCVIDLLSINTPKHYFDYKANPGVQSHYRQVELIDVYTNISILGAISNLFSSKSYHISRFESGAFRRKLIEMLEQSVYDVVLLESIFVAPYIETIRKHSKAKVILRAHNVEYLIWERVADHMGNPIKKRYLQYLTRKLKNFEVSTFGQIDGLVPISPVDRDVFRQLGYSGPEFTYPVAMYTADMSHRLPSEMGGRTVSFIGSLDWIPNQEGLIWFVRVVWPLVLKRLPDAVFYIAGRHITEEVHGLALKRVRVLGEVEDATAFLQEHPVTVVPLFSGSGMRVKVIEAMALGPIVISTKVGAEGIQYQADRHLLIAEEAEEFARQVCAVLEDIPAYDQISSNARQLVEEHYDASALGRRLSVWMDSL